MLADIQNSILFYLQHYSSYVGFIAFFAAFLESLIGVGYFLPGSTILLIMGVVAGQGVIDIKIVLFFAFIGAFSGDQINYFLGRRYGVVIVKNSWLHLSGDIVRKAEVFLDNYGAISVFFGRLLPGIKEAISFVAGTLKMRYYKFIFWEFLGAFVWSLEFIGVGYLFSTSLSLAQLWLTRSVYILVVLVLFFTIVYMLIYVIKQNSSAIVTLLRSFKNQILKNKKVKRWMSNHPKTINFIKKRIDRTTFSGLPFTLLASTFIYILALFGGIVEDFLSKDPIVAIDHIVANIIPTLRTVKLNEFFTYITLLGKTEIVVAFLILSMIVLFLYRKKNYILPLLISLIGSSLFTYISKLVFHRPRPDIAIYRELSYSFPSGHATVAVALYGFIGYLLIHFTQNIKTKFNIFFIFTIIILLIGISRIYLGEHYLSDIYGGYLLGTLWLIVGVVFTHWIEEKRKIDALEPRRHAKLFSVFASLVFMVFFVTYSQLFHYAKMPIKIAKKRIVTSAIKTIEAKNHLTQSLVGLDAWPINIIFVGKSLAKLKEQLKQENWREFNKNFIKSLPIYWMYKKSNLFLTKNENKKRYLLKIWETNSLISKNEHIFVAVSIEIDGDIWQVIPRFSQDIDDARRYVTNTFKKANTITKSSNKAFTGDGILGNNYFTDGKCSIIYLSKRQQSDK